MSRRRHLPQRSTIHAHGRRSAAAQSHRPRRPSRAQTCACIAACVRACVPACVSVRACARARTCRFPSADACPSAQVWSVKFDRSCVVSGSYDKTVKVTFPPQNCACAKRIVTIAKPAAIDRVLTDPYWPGRWSVPLNTLHFVAIWRHAAQLRRTWNAHEPRAALTPQAAWRARPELPLSARSLPSNRCGTARRVHASRRCAATAAG